MAFDVEQTVTSELQHSKFTIQLVESTFGSSNILMAYVRFYSPTLNNTVDEFLFADYLETGSKGKTIFLCLKEYLNKLKIPFDNISAVLTDGAPAMVGCYRCFSVFLKGKVPTVYAVHCVLHRQHLVAKKLSGELHEALKVCIRSINKIKAHPLNYRLFAKLCEENDETFNQLLLHTEVRWLSRGDNLQRIAPCYKAKLVMRYLKDQEVEVMGWPPQSIDLNLMENLGKTSAKCYDEKCNKNAAVSSENSKQAQERAVVHVSVQWCTCACIGAQERAVVHVSVQWCTWKKMIPLYTTAGRATA
ncbi:Ribonuclease H-like domain [Trinorchestia longiramus]|nr:Ribonuclease H-like domain [Trinorchestia longiramus]